MQKVAMIPLRKLSTIYKEEIMILSTVCYIEQEGKYLMLHRTKKKNDVNQDKWIGVGGKFEDKESPEECVIREVQEETGLTLQEYQLRGVVTYVADEWETEYMYVFTATKVTGEMASDCVEGDLQWVEKDKLLDLNLWEGDKLFLRKMAEGCRFFSAKFVYDGNRLMEHTIKEY